MWGLHPIGIQRCILCKDKLLWYTFTNQLIHVPWIDSGLLCACDFQPDQHRQFLFTGSLDLTIVHKRILHRSLHCKNHKDMTFHTVSTSDYTNSWAINIIATHRSSWPTVYVPPKEMVWRRPGRINHTIPHHLLDHHRLSMLHSTRAHSLPPLTRWPPQPRICKQEWSIDFLNSKLPS